MQVKYLSAKCSQFKKGDLVAHLHYLVGIPG